MSRLVLARVTLFEGFSEEDLDHLAASLRRRRYAGGQVIFARGDPGASLYIVQEGTVKISLASPDGKEFVLAVLGPGEFFGELALLDDEPRSADAVAQEACQLLLLSRDDFTRFLETRPGVALRLLAVLSRRLRNADQMLQDAFFLDVPARLARVLLELAETRGRPEGGGTAIASRLTQAELAGMVGATRESVNRWLGFYQRRGLIRYDRGLITVLRPEELRRRVC